MPEPREEEPDVISFAATSTPPATEDDPEEDDR